MCGEAARLCSALLGWIVLTKREISVMKTRPLYFQSGGFTSVGVWCSSRSLLFEPLMQFYKLLIFDLIFSQRVLATGTVEIDHVTSLGILQRRLI